MPPTAGKRPFSQALPEPPPDPIQGTAIVVIHPGSENLRIGKASDSFPITVPHCIAWRQKHKDTKTQKCQKLLRQEWDHKNCSSQREAGLKQAQEAVNARLTSNGEQRKATSFREITSFNKKVSGEKTDVKSPITWTNTSQSPAYIVGQEALYIHPRGGYSLNWPIKYGQLNIHGGPGGSLPAVLQDLETIWSTAIQTHLDIPLKDLKHYRVILLIPDIIIHQHVKHLLTLLLDTMKFGAAIVYQESVCATFGAGISGACVIDVGAEKTSVSCVEDGISIKESRLCLNYGGNDIISCFHWLLTRASFPYKDCDLANQMDVFLLQDLVNSYCHMDQDLCGIDQQLIQVKQPDCRITNYAIQMGDERLIATLAVFHPDLFGLSGDRLTVLQKSAPFDSDDPWDSSYLAQTQSRHEQSAKQNAAKKRENADQANQSLDLTDDTNSQSQIMVDDDSNDATDVTIDRMPSQPVEAEDSKLDGSLLGLDQAILYSIAQSGDSDDLKKRLYSNLLVVGGGLTFHGVQGWLHYKVLTQMPGQYRIQLETMDVITRPKDLEPTLVCWKGASVLSCLDTTQELWIKPGEWKKLSTRVLRERSSFLW